MSRRISIGWLFLLAAPLCGHSTGASAQSLDGVGLALGAAPAPVVIEDLDGGPADLAGYIGDRPVLLEFWATWCENCAALAPKMDRAFTEYGGRIHFLAIAVGVNQTPRSIRRHLLRHPMAHTVLWDSDGRATRAFEAPTTSYIVILDERGRVAYTGVGADQDIEGAIRRVLR